MRPAGGQLNLDQVSKNPSVNDGKSRLFGLAQDENVYGGEGYVQQNSMKGKRILNGQDNSYHNVIGGAYMAAQGEAAPPMYGGQVPMQDMMYYPPPY